MSISEVERAVEYFDTTQEWLDFYLNEAYRLKRGESSSSSQSVHDARQAQRLAYLSTVVNTAVLAKRYQLDNGGFRDIVRALTAGAGLLSIPGLKTGVKVRGVHEFSVVAIKSFGMADSSKVESLYKEALSKGGLITNMSGFRNDVIRESYKDFGKELIKEYWKDENLQEVLLDEMRSDLGRDVADEVFSYVAHFAPVVGHGFNGISGWQSSGKHLDEVTHYLSRAAVEFHKKVFIPVVMARVLCVSFFFL
jgi:hypothetical protein